MTTMHQPAAVTRRIPPTLLVVEDEAVVAMDLDGQLHDMGYRVCGRVDNGRDAIERARAERPDLILMDIVLKGDVDGIDAAAEIGRELHIPVLFLSAYSDDETVERAAAAWPYGYLTKPFQNRELRAGIEVALRKAEVERRLRESERWLAAVLRGVGDAVIATDAVGRVGLANPAAERLLGLHDLPGRLASDVVHLHEPDGHAALSLAPDPAHAAGRDLPASRAALLVAHDGARIPVDYTVGTIADEAGRLAGLAIVLHDVRERAAAQNQLARSEHRFRNAFDNAPLGLALIDRGNRFVRINRALCRLLDAEPAQLVGTDQAACGDAADNAIEQAAWRDLTQGRSETVQYERRYRGAEGRMVCALVSASLLPANADPQQFLVQIDDVTQRKQAEEALAHMAHHDALTGVANRTLLSEETEHALAVARRQGSRLAIVFIDLDYFKHVNDSLGHQAGDAVLKELAQRLTHVVRAVDIVGRMGGDEFVVVLCGVTDAHHVLALTDKLRSECARPIAVGAHEVRLAVSMGVSLFPDDAHDFHTLLRFADSALYQAKGEGRNNVQFYRPELTVRMELRTRLGAGLRAALERNELEMHYQPIVALGNGRPAAAEALIRWRHPELGLLLPDVFLPVLEESSMGEAIGAWTLREACRQAARWNAPGAPPLRVSVNVTAAQFRSGTLVRTVEDALRDTGLASARLCIEITEQHQLADDDNTRRVLAALKDLGVLVAIDDFGTGYSSLGYIIRLRPDEIKIDKSLVTNVDTDPQPAGLVTAALAMARSLDLEVVSEGVETAAELEFLRARGCDMVQGFLYARPGPAAEFERWLADGAPPGGMRCGT